MDTTNNAIKKPPPVSNSTVNTVWGECAVSGYRIMEQPYA